ncbi:MAG: hypothetical protein Q9227_009482 [Pyrenula ochraceoflavens]
MAADDAMDIDIDLDADFPDVEIVEPGEASPVQPPPVVNVTDHDRPAAYGLSELDIQPTKINLSGFNDQTTTAHLVNFLNSHFDNLNASKKEIEWIDDSSANLIFPSPAHASQALITLSVEPQQASRLDSLQARPAKNPGPFQDDNLQVRMAILTDKKKSRAAEASRFYLLHPEHDPRERMTREFQNGRPRRGRGNYGGVNGDYRRNRYDDREHDRRLRNGDGNGEEFSASMYDDEAQSDSGAQYQKHRQQQDLFDDRYSRRNGGGKRNRSASPPSNPQELEVDILSDDDTTFRKRRRTNGFRTRSPPSRRQNNIGKELFSSNITSSSTMLQSDKDLSNSATHITSDPTTDPFPPSSANNRLRAANLRKELFAANSPPRKELLPSPFPPKSSNKELFPHKTDRSNHRRTDGVDLDARSSPDTSLPDTFSSSLAVPLVDGAGDRQERINKKANGEGMSIKGTAAKTGLRIKGMGSQNVKELFPGRYGADDGKANRGKELFDEVLEGRGSKGRGRVKAGDLFG